MLQVVPWCLTNPDVIAISYRREDSTPIAGRIHDRLQAEFGKKSVFMDFDSIPYGVDFREQIKQTLERARVVVAIIGPAWLGGRAGVDQIALGTAPPITTWRRVRIHLTPDRGAGAGHN